MGEARQVTSRCPAMNTRAGLAPSPEGIRLIREPPESRQHHPRAIEPTLPASSPGARVAPDRPRSTSPPSGGGAPFDWIIVGGGPHGVCAARALTARGASVRIVDPSGVLLERWSERARAVKMVWMRSPAGHHLDAQPVSLHHFLHRPEHADVAELAGTLRRPTHEAFLRHSLEVVDTAGLDRSVVRGRVSSIQRRNGESIVLGDGLELRGRRVLIATGSNTPRIPAWAKRLRDEGAPIRHVFEGDAPLDLDLVGGGISSVQRALMVHRATRRTVRVWMRHPLREAEFDFDRDWTKHRFAAEWNALDESARIDFLARHTGRGSVPGGLARRVERAVRNGSLRVAHELPEFEWDAAAQELRLRGAEGTVRSSGVTLLTGLEPESISGWLRSTADDLGLPVVHGMPRLGADMEWGEGIHVTGSLARLRLGPMAPNLVGARWATSLLPGVRMQPV